MSAITEYDLRVIASFDAEDSVAGRAVAHLCEDRIEAAETRVSEAKIGCEDISSDIRFALGYRAAWKDAARMAAAAKKRLNDLERRNGSR